MSGSLILATWVFSGVVGWFVARVMFIVIDNLSSWKRYALKEKVCSVTYGQMLFIIPSVILAPVSVFVALFTTLVCGIVALVEFTMTLCQGLDTKREAFRICGGKK